MLESKSMLFSLAGSGQSSSSCYHTVYQNQFLPGKAVPSVRYLGARIQYVGKILMRWVHAFMLQNGSGHKWSVFDTGLYRPSVGRCCSTLYLCILFFCQALKLLSWNQANTSNSIHWFSDTLASSCRAKGAPSKFWKLAASKLQPASQKLFGYGWGLCPCELGLQIRRLSWYQQLAGDNLKT